MNNLSKLLIAYIIGFIVLICSFVVMVKVSIYEDSCSHSYGGSLISEQEKISFNQQWNTYEGEQRGNNVKALLQKMIANCNTNKEEDDRLVSLYVGAGGTSESEEFNVSKWVPIKVGGKLTIPESYLDVVSVRGDKSNSYSPEQAVGVLTKIRNSIEAKHIYNVFVVYSDETQLVDVVGIIY